ncbi:MAG: hypothetical protein ACTS73_05835 [Arsenophonus sp. NEOnobi-MAG3]
MFISGMMAYTLLSVRQDNYHCLAVIVAVNEHGCKEVVSLKDGIESQKRT